MSRLTLTPHSKWQSAKCSNDCVCQNGEWLVPCTDHICSDYPMGYITGKKPPNYLVPAIPYNVIIEQDYVAVHGKYAVSFATWHKK